MSLISYFIYLVLYNQEREIYIYLNFAFFTFSQFINYPCKY